MTEPAPEVALEPTPEQVHGLIPRRAVPGFSETSKPTRAQVLDIVTGIADELRAEVANGDVPADLRPYASRVIAYGAAALVELTYFPEQAGDSTYTLWQERFTAGMRRLREHLAGRGLLLTPIGGDAGGGSETPVRRFRSGSVRVHSATAPELLVTPLPITTEPVEGDGMVTAVSTAPPPPDEQLVVDEPA